MDFEYFRSDAQLNFDLGFKNEVDVRKSVERVKDADVVVFVGGVSPNLEGEEMGVELPGFRGGDRTEIAVRIPTNRKGLFVSYFSPVSFNLFRYSEGM